MNIRLLVSTVFIGASLSAQVPIVIRIGPPPPPVIRIQPVSPGAGYMWIDGYQYPVANRYVWHDGYWTRPPYEGARWQAPRYEGDSYYVGRWSGDRGEIGHDHRWDHNRGRDFRHEDKDDDKDKDNAKHKDKRNHDNRR